MKKIRFFTLGAIVFLSPFFVKSQNMLDTSTWTIGSGGVEGFSQNGATAENSREYGLNHLGDNVILWKATPDGSNNADGGWVTSWFHIDKTKTYRITVWIIKSNSIDGTTYFGCNEYQGDQILRLDNTLNTNPYFWSGDLPMLDRWYLLVGFVHSENYTSVVHEGRIYDGVTGEPVVNIQDFKFNSNASTLRQRAFLYYDTNTNDKQFFYAPRIEMMTGDEPTINELLGINEGAKLLLAYDASGNQTQRFYCPDSGCSPPPAPSRISDENPKEKDEIVEKLNEGDSSSGTLKVYPNPVENISYVQIEPELLKKVTSIKLYNVNSVLVQDLSSNLNGREISIDFSSKASGVYFLHIHVEGKNSITKKIIKN